MDTNRLKAILDLREYLDTIGSDRPKLIVMLKKLNITGQTMSDAVTAAAMNIKITEPYVGVHVADDLFKLGVTIGYKYAVSMQMDQSFGVTDEPSPDGEEGEEDDE